MKAKKAAATAAEGMAPVAVARAAAGLEAAATVVEAKDAAAAAQRRISRATAPTTGWPSAPAKR